MWVKCVVVFLGYKTRRHNGKDMLVNQRLIRYSVGKHCTSLETGVGKERVQRLCRWRRGPKSVLKPKMQDTTEWMNLHLILEVQQLAGDAETKGDRQKMSVINVDVYDNRLTQHTTCHTWNIRNWRHSLQRVPPLLPLSSTRKNLCDSCNLHKGNVLKYFNGFLLQLIYLLTGSNVISPFSF
jgi:hypothetical protein